MFILFQVPLINKNGTKSMHCIIRGKFVISPCRKSALFWIHAVILLFRAEILPCGPPLLPHSCAEPFLGVVQKYSFLGDIYTFAQTWFPLLIHCSCIVPFSCCQWSYIWDSLHFAVMQSMINMCLQRVGHFHLNYLMVLYLS